MVLNSGFRIFLGIFCSLFFSPTFAGPGEEHFIFSPDKNENRDYSKEKNDTLPSHDLQEVKIQAVRPSSVKATSPLQFLDGEELQRLNPLQVSDAVKYFSGVQVKDYGGVGGLKTISVRSLGANYTAISYDGIAISDYQTGQIDLGKYSTDNISFISLQIGESDDIFQTARMLASAGALNIITNAPQFNKNKYNQLKAGIKGGSFGFFNPSLCYDRKISEVFSAQINTEWMQTDGNYPFDHILGANNDSSIQRKRSNSDVKTLKAEANLRGKFKNGGKLLFKLSIYDSERGLPGAANYWDDYSEDRADEVAYSVQAQYIRVMNENWDFQSNARFSFSHSDYLAIDNAYPDGRQENIYYQREYYFNTTVRYKLSPDISFSWANDASYGNFRNNFPNHAAPSRISWQSAFAGKYENDYLSITGSLLSNYNKDAVKTGSDPDDIYKLSPYAGISVKPFKKLPLRFRAFYKNTYRLPTFGDMYYPRMPRPDLKPENANQLNLGISWISEINELLPYFSFIADIYQNKIDNKIVALPTSNMFIWSVQNYGKVAIKGVDFGIKLHIHTGEKIRWHIGSNLTLQKVLDKTDSNSSSYNQQLPYTPRYSGSGIISMITPWLDINYNILYSGKRYYTNINKPQYALDKYIEYGISLQRSFDLNKLDCSLSLECLNLFDEQYEVVRSYPMPGRQWRCGLKIKI